MAACVLAAVLCLLDVRVALAQRAPSPSAPSDPWYGRSPNPKRFEAPKTPLGPFAIELPKDWQIVPGQGGIIFTAAEKTGNDLPAAALLVEHVQLRGTIEVTPAIAENELASIREREPGGEGFAQQIKKTDGRAYIFIEFGRPGLGRPDRVVQYSIPSGSVMYRLICIAPAVDLVRKYQQIFAHVAASFKPMAAAAK